MVRDEQEPLYLLSISFSFSHSHSPLLSSYSSSSFPRFHRFSDHEWCTRQVGRKEGRRTIYRLNSVRATVMIVKAIIGSYRCERTSVIKFEESYLIVPGESRFLFASYYHRSTGPKVLKLYAWNYFSKGQSKIFASFLRFFTSLLYTFRFRNLAIIDDFCEKIDVNAKSLATRLYSILVNDFQNKFFVKKIQKKKNKIEKKRATRLSNRND